MKEVILTGIRSNEEPTIGNYLGAFLPMIELQRSLTDNQQLNMFVPDLHSITTATDYSLLYDNTLRNIRYYLAAGLDIAHPRTYIYRQSYISAHSELTWILDCFASMGELQRMTQFKEKSSQLAGSVTVGLFNYPVMMAADILLYNTRWVPVGEDQFQHLEITRDIATRFNGRFGEIFTIPEPTAKQTQFIQRDSGLRIRDLTDPTKKMSKSTNDAKSKINLSDSPATARKKIMSCTTDSLASVNFDWQQQPGITNLLQLLATLTGRPQGEVNQQWTGVSQYSQLKQAVADAVDQFLTSFHERLLQIDQEMVLAKLSQSEAEMRQVADQTLLRAQQAVGLRAK